jgi:hemoglobin
MMVKERAPWPKRALCERLGGRFAIAAVVDQFSDAVIANPKGRTGLREPRLDVWSTERRDRLAGLKFMRTLCVAASPAARSRYVGTASSTAVGLEEAHAPGSRLGEFDEVAGEVGTHLDAFGVPERRRARSSRRSRLTKGEVTEGDARGGGYRTRAGRAWGDGVSRVGPAPSRRPARPPGGRSSCAAGLARPADCSPPRTPRRRRAGGWTMLVVASAKLPMSA